MPVEGEGYSRSPGRYKPIRSMGCISLVVSLLCCSGSSERRTAKMNLGDLRTIILAYNREQVDFFNKILRPDDVVASWAGHAQLMKYVHGPKRLISAPSIEKLKTALERVGDTHIDYINYNPEVWKTHDTPEEELRAPVETVEKIRDICVQQGGRPLRDERGEKVLKPMKAEEVLRKLELVASMANGIAILYPEEGKAEMKELIRLLRG